MEFSCSFVQDFQAKKTTFASFYAMFSDSDHLSLCYCTDMQGLFQMISTAYSASDWRLLIDSSKRRLKAVHLHNGNVYSSIPIAHSVQMKEDSESAKIILELIQCNDHNWDICGDFKVIVYFWDCKEVIQSILVFFVCGMIEGMSSITWSKTGKLAKISHQAPTMF